MPHKRLVWVNSPLGTVVKCDSEIHYPLYLSSSDIIHHPSSSSSASALSRLARLVLYTLITQLHYSPLIITLISLRDSLEKRLSERWGLDCGCNCKTWQGKTNDRMRRDETRTRRDHSWIYYPLSSTLFNSIPDPSYTVPDIPIHFFNKIRLNQLKDIPHHSSQPPGLTAGDALHFLLIHRQRSHFYSHFSRL